MGNSSLRVNAAIIFPIVGMMSAFSGPTAAQSVPPGASQPGGGGLSGSLSHADLERLSGDRTRSEESALVRAQAKAQSDELAKALQLSCEVSEAEQVGTRRTTVDGNEIEASVYEVACSNGMGYFLMSQGAEKPVGISCFAAEGTRAADAANGKTPDLICRLPGNKDVKIMAASLMAGAGTACAVRDYQWFGKSVGSQSEYSEVVCNDGQGFLLRTALPGTPAPTRVMSCVDAARQGLKCRLTNAGPVTKPLLTLQSVKDTLVANGVTCGVDKIRVVGQEDVRKRYVVEYLCANETEPTVAFVPLPENTNAYESMDCAAAVARKVLCEFMPLK